MKKTVLLALTCVLGAGTQATDPSVSEVVVNQRWPWSEKVDVDFTLAGETADVGMTATWDGQPLPVLLGTLFSCTPGSNRFTWDPSASFQAGKTLTGFAVTLVPTPVGERNYLVLDLRNGGYSFLADVPSGGWTDEYKTKKMVFRRVPAGSYALGMTTDELKKWYGSSSDKSYKEERLLRGTRTQIFSSDFFLAVFQMTAAQYETVCGGAGTSPLPKLISYDELRGTTNAADGVCWPATQYAVAPDSFLGKLRRRANAALVIDLPTEEQWEAAARAGTATVFPNGGSTSDTDAGLWAIAEQSTWKGVEMQTVGQKDADNASGFYDMFGNRLEWTLDVWMVDGYGRPIAPEAGTDSAGYVTWKDASSATVEGNIKKINAAYGQRTVRSAYPKSTAASVQSVLPSARNGRSSATSGECTARLCIHLKPLKFAQ